MESWLEQTIQKDLLEFLNKITFEKFESFTELSFAVKTVRYSYNVFRKIILLENSETHQPIGIIVGGKYRDYEPSNVLHYAVIVLPTINLCYEFINYSKNKKEFIILKNDEKFGHFFAKSEKIKVLPNVNEWEVFKDAEKKAFLKTKMILNNSIIECIDGEKSAIKLVPPRNLLGCLFFFTSLTSWQNSDYVIKYLDDYPDITEDNIEILFLSSLFFRSLVFNFDIDFQTG